MTPSGSGSSVSRYWWYSSFKCAGGADRQSAGIMPSSRSSPVEWCNRFVSFGVGYAVSLSGGSSCPVGWGVSRDLVRMSRLR